MRIIEINGWSEHGTVQGNVVYVEVYDGTKTYRLKFLQLNDKIWKLEEISDANSALEKETHISVTG